MHVRMSVFTCECLFLNIKIGIQMTGLESERSSTTSMSTAAKGCRSILDYTHQSERGKHQAADATGTKPMVTKPCGDRKGLDPAPIHQLQPVPSHQLEPALTPQLDPAPSVSDETKSVKGDTKAISDKMAVYIRDA